MATNRQQAAGYLQAAGAFLAPFGQEMGPTIPGFFVGGLGAALSLVGSILQRTEDVITEIERLRDIDKERQAIDDFVNGTIK